MSFARKTLRIYYFVISQYNSVLIDHNICLKNNMQHNYAREKFAIAVERLNDGSGDIKQRLISAYSSFHPVVRNDLPTELQNNYSWIMDRLTRKSALVSMYGDRNVSGALEQTMHFMRLSAASEIAMKIRQIALQLDEYCDEVT